jgi:hypothetical protein
MRLKGGFTRSLLGEPVIVFPKGFLLSAAFGRGGILDWEMGEGESM